MGTNTIGRQSWRFFACARGKSQKIQVDQVNEDYLSTVSSICILPALCYQNHGVEIHSELTGE